MKKLLVLLYILAPSLAPAGYELHSDSGINGPSYEEIVQDFASLSQETDWVHLLNIGQTVQGRDTVAALVYQPGVKIKKLVTISGATHGNEYVGIVNNLLRQFLYYPTSGLMQYFARGGAIFVLPIVNPDGYVADRRTNANGKDLNRDFPLAPLKMSGLTQPETRNFVGYVHNLLTATGASYEVAMDYHCCYGGLLYPFSYKRERMPKDDLLAHIQIAELMVDLFPNYKHGITGELLGYFPKGTSKDFWYLQYGARAYTFEGQHRTEDKKLQQHISWWSHILSSL